MTRTFIALEPPERVRAALAHEITRLRAMLPAVRWADAGSIHLTLAFLGELDDDRLALAREAARLAAAEAAPFRLRVTGLGTFGPPHAPRIVWMGIGGEEAALHEVQTRLATALAERGFPREERPFSPHLTLARLKAPLRTEEVARLRSLLEQRHPPLAWPVDALHVMKSELRRPAAIYTSLLACPFGV